MMNRREMIKTSAALAGAALLGPTGSGRTPKADQKQRDAFKNIAPPTVIGNETIDTLSMPASSNNFSATSASNDDGCIVA